MNQKHNQPKGLLGVAVQRIVTRLVDKLNAILVFAAKLAWPRRNRRASLRLLETLDLVFEPVYLSILLLYKLAKIRVLLFQRFYLRVRSRQLLAKHGRQRNFFEQVSNESHNGIGGDGVKSSNEKS